MIKIVFQFKPWSFRIYYTMCKLSCQVKAAEREDSEFKLTVATEEWTECV